MHVVVRRYVGASKLIDVTLERQSDVREVISSVPGFRAYYGVRAGDGGMLTVTVCDDEAGTSESSRRAAEWVRNNVPGMTIDPPEIIAGETYLNF
ncbi:hypothetical protein GCM10010472_23470 [Pseudonocardia halophobica]|uniref:Uncharacterized protein n=1 Tax=Pseudonocardia halophobica TaxID=29401 RepID=A0A9W6NTS4_9PSEU|nr:hypothetical protein [Pseudonocardia halophobica]GLL09580.1 hypothetical protein GCM10017577_07200 [Pseudonocardia halophobica]